MNQKDPKDLTLWDVAASIEDSCVELEEALDAMRLLGERFEDEGYQDESKFDEIAAISFVNRFPMYLSTYRVTLRAIQQGVEGLKEVSDRTYEAHKAQNVGRATV